MKESAFVAIDIDACIEAIKDAEGGPKRERPARAFGSVATSQRSWIMRRSRRSGTRTWQPAPASARKQLEKTAGDLGARALPGGQKGRRSRITGGSPHRCPLCDGTCVHSLRDHLASRLSELEALGLKPPANTWRWNGTRPAGLNSCNLGHLSRTAPSKRLLAVREPRPSVGSISKAEAEALVEHLAALRTRVGDIDAQLAAEQVQLEQHQLPPSSKPSR